MGPDPDPGVEKKGNQLLGYAALAIILLVLLGTVVDMWFWPQQQKGLRPEIAALVAAGEYDEHLCEIAQRLVVNAERLTESESFPITVLRGEGNGYYTI